MLSRIKIPKMTRRNKLLITLALIAIAIPSYLIYNYTQNNPKFCTTCHLMSHAYETWHTSAMNELNCHECHETDMLESMGHVVEVLTLNPQKVTKITEIDNELCEHCHACNEPKETQVTYTGGHKVHIFEKEDPPACIDCHGLVLHEFGASEYVCEECHTERSSKNAHDQILNCTDCHEFSARLLFPKKEDCIDCHDFARKMSIMEETPHKSTQVETNCLSCHNPHMDKLYYECDDCHDTSGLGLHGITDHNECETCHTPHSEAEMRDSCLSCHTDRKEHETPVECYNCHFFKKLIP